MLKELVALSRISRFDIPNPLEGDGVLSSSSPFNIQNCSQMPEVILIDLSRFRSISRWQELRVDNSLLSLIAFATTLLYNECLSIYLGSRLSSQNKLTVWGILGSFDKTTGAGEDRNILVRTS